MCMCVCFVCICMCAVYMHLYNFIIMFQISTSHVFQEVTFELFMDEGLRREYSQIIGTTAHWQRYSPKILEVNSTVCCAH